jgi:uncharacterized membrane protein YeaQ/YmgE (transglycosylase-associated protein family)
MITVICWLVFGWLVGSIAEWLWPPQAPHSGWTTVAIGVGGSIAGGVVGSVIMGSTYSPAGFVMSVAGALLVMFVWHKYNEVV